MSNKTKAAAIGGGALLLLALLSILVPVKGFNFLCCVWALVCGALAVYVYNRKSATAARPGEGAVLGALAGLIGGLPFVIVFPIIGMYVGNRLQAAIEEQLRQMGQPAELPMSIFAMTLIVGVASALLITGLATIGGVIGASIFKGNAQGGTDAAPPSTPPPVPPPDFSR
ncbi:MAG TPA: hypothetical protein VF666_17290 [Pyrinomonadaceae bacterium]|jgi:hypothetical protein